MTTLLLSGAGLYAVFVALVYLGQSSLLYLPGVGGRDLAATPATVGLAYDEVRLPTVDGETLHGWYVHTPDPRATLLFLHGNAGNISHRLDSIRIFADLGLDVLIVDYRGYGQSSGRPDEAGTYRDADAAWKHLTVERGLAPGRILLFGRSLGASVATELATRVPAAGLILESAFTSVPDLGAELYPFLPVRLLSRFDYDSRTRIGSVRMPVLVVHSPGDEVIPFRHGQALFSAASSPKQFLEIRGGHNDGFWVSGPVYREGLARFLAGLGLDGLVPK